MDTNANSPQLLKRAEVAKLLRVSPRSIDRLCRTGRLRRIWITNRLVRFLESDVTRMVQRQRTKGGSTGEVLDFDSPASPESDVQDADSQRQDVIARASQAERWEDAAPIPTRAQRIEHAQPAMEPPAQVSRPLASRPRDAAAKPLGRNLPHSLEAEEYLLASCMLDGSDVVPRCEAAGISPASFYDPKHETMYGCILDLFRKGISTDVSVVAEHLKTARQLDLVGGYALLAQVSSRIPTTAQAGYFIEKVRELSVLRQIIRAATGAVEECYGFTGGDIAEFAADMEAKLATATGRGFREAVSTERSFMDYEPPPVNDDSILLGKYRFLCRGGALIEVGTSGAGKSSASLHQATMWALGRDWLGITCTRPLKSLIIQAEDDDGDIGEIRESIVKGLSLSNAEIAQVRRNVIICDERVRSGNELIRELKRLVAKHKPDLVWLNPLLRYAACDITKQSEWSQFYSGLNSVNAERRFAYIFIHHTNKPPSSKEKPDRSWNEYMYNMTGSADIVNAVRAVILFEAQAEEGRFLVRLAKRGKRAGLTRETKPADEYSPAIVEPVTVIYARWSKEVVKLPDGRAFPMMFWCPDAAPASDDESATPKRPGPAPKITFEDLRPAFVGRCPSPEKPAPFMQILHAVVAIDGTISKQLFAKILKSAVEDGKVVKCADGRAVERAIRTGIRPPAHGREYRRRNLARNGAYERLWWALWSYADALLAWRLRVASLLGNWPTDSQGRSLPLASLGPPQRVPGWLAGQRREAFCAMRNAYLEMEDFRRRYREFRRNLLDGYRGPLKQQAASLRDNLDLHLARMVPVLDAHFRILVTLCDADVPDEAVGARTRPEDWHAIEQFAKDSEVIGRRLDEWSGRWFHE